MNSFFLSSPPSTTTTTTILYVDRYSIDRYILLDFFHFARGRGGKKKW